MKKCFSETNRSSHRITEEEKLKLRDEKHRNTLLTCLEMMAASAPGNVRVLLCYSDMEPVGRAGDEFFLKNVGRNVYVQNII